MFTFVGGPMRVEAKRYSSGDHDSLDEEEHISALQNEIKSKDEVIYNVCSKYFKLKKSKGGLKKKFDALQTHMHKVN
ncbi:jg8878 [Pararge aegeria aegeria]|uniref:Jg8878 protein n=1 Tax=Pararge aegeria aegeria TaxID=348720 RepID=A0A8S4R7U1_9NEOP|nr:jg8878 [Pararge aegeria aegeria]